MALMFSHGEFSGEMPMPECAIFSDTGAEPSYVYEWLKWLTPRLAFPVHIISKGNLRDDIIRSVDGERYAGAPFFTESDKSEKGGMLRRQCTREYKVEPIEKKVREIIGLKRGEHAPRDTLLARQYIGIFLDEIIRIKPSRKKFINNEYPLIEKKMSRGDCLAWMKSKGYPLPKKSACTFCPYRHDSEWRAMKKEDPASFAEAVMIDEKIRRGVRGTKQKLYVHKSLKPLADIDFEGEQGGSQIDMFNEECEGMCGL